MSAAQVGGWVPDLDAAGPHPPPPPPASLASVPSGDRIIVVAAGGGVGRSTTADLMARQLCVAGPLILIDDAPGLVSPRRTLDRGQNGLAALVGYGGNSYEVLAPDSPTARVDAVAAVEAMSTGWATLVVDSYDSVLGLLQVKRWRRLLTEPGARVLLVTASATAPVQQAITAARALRQAGVRPEDLVAAVVDISAGRVPRPTLARMLMLEGEVSAMTRVPHLPHVRATGRLEEGRGGRAAERAAAGLVQRLALEEAA